MTSVMPLRTATSEQHLNNLLHVRQYTIENPVNYEGYASPDGYKALKCFVIVN